MQWQKTFGGSEYDIGYSVQQLSDGGYLITGETDSFGAGREDVYLIKTDSSGNMQWEKAIGGGSYDIGSSSQQTSDGGYIVARTTQSYGAGIYDVYLIKLEPYESPNGVTVRGIIHEVVNDEALSNVKVKANGKETWTDSYGEYEITNLQPNQITVSASKQGGEAKI